MASTKIYVKQHTTRSQIHQQDFNKHPTFQVTYTSMCTTAMPKFPTFPRYFRLSHLQFHDAEAMDKIHKLALAIRDDCLYSNHQLLQPSKFTFRFTLQCLHLYTSTLVPHWLPRNATNSSSKTCGLIHWTDGGSCVQSSCPLYPIQRASRPLCKYRIMFHNVLAGSFTWLLGNVHHQSVPIPLLQKSRYLGEFSLLIDWSSFYQVILKPSHVWVFNFEKLCTFIFRSTAA